MTTTTNVPQVKINVMTQSQFDVADKSSTELYMITDAEVLPSQSGQSGKFLTTDGTTASWANVSGSGSTDDVTIELNGDNELQVIGTINKNTETGATNPIYDWVGTLAEYQTQQIKTLHPEWLCYITDDLDASQGASNIDNSTITTNSEDKIQTVAVVNSNNAIGATNPIYDWVGTYEEYINNNIATIHPEYICYITDDYNYEDKFRTEVAERNIGEIVYSLIPVSDAGLHLLDGNILDGEGIYAAFYNYMVSVYSSAPQIFCSEEDWQTSVTTYGVCGKFVLDTENVTIRLPKVTGFIEGTIVSSEIGALVEAGLPNITGKFANGEGEYQILPMTRASGAFANGGSSTISAHDIDGGWHGGKLNGVSFDASRSSSIYGNSTTVQPQAIKGYVYMVVANTIKTPVEVDIDQIAVDIDQIATELNACYSHRVISFQEPTSSNNYTWYRKYADGWVEQGGFLPKTNGDVQNTVTLSIPMADSNYTVTTQTTDETANGSVAWFCYTIQNQTTTGFKAYTGTYWGRYWRVEGMAA